MEPLGKHFAFGIFKASPDEIKITREGDYAIIAYAIIEFIVIAFVVYYKTKR